MQQEFPCRAFDLRHVGEAYLNVIGFEKLRQERNRTRQARDVGDHERGAIGAAHRQRIGELRAVRVSTAFDFGKLANQFPLAAVEIIDNSLALGVEPEARDALLIGRDTIVRNESPGIEKTKTITSLAFLASHSNCDRVRRIYQQRGPTIFRPPTRLSTRFALSGKAKSTYERSQDLRSE